MLKFTFDELVKIERTLERSHSALSPLVDSQTKTNLSLATYILAEVRLCAQTLEMSDEETRPQSLKTKAVDRLVSMIQQAVTERV